MDTTSKNTNGVSKEEEERAAGRSEKTPRSPKGAANQEIALRTPEVIDISQPTDLELLGQQIGIIVELFGDRAKRSINNNDREEIDRVKILFNKVANAMGDKRAAEVLKDTGTQTSPWFKIPESNKRKPANETEKPTPKRAKSRPTRKKDILKMGQRERAPSTDSTRNTVNKDKERSRDYEWRQVERKKPAKKPKPLRKPRPDAIVIEAKDGQSYADILRKVKTDASLASIGEAVTRIRRTQKGELLLQFKDSGDSTAAFQNSIREKLGESADVRTLTQRTMVEMRDVDEVTDAQDISEAIKAQLELEVPAEAIRLRKAYGETQIATINLPGEEANKMIKAGKIKIGWTVCRIRERTVLKKCFKCLEFGHIATQCRNEDRSKLCRSCGKDGHIAKDCREEPLCMFCKKDRPKDAKHIAGSSRCPVFRRALKDKR